MTTLRISTRVNAPIAVCFDLARSVDAHLASTAATSERAVAGVTRGLLALGDEVTWEATHLGVRQRLRVRITAFEPPHRFVDEMVAGVFRRMRHEHVFESTANAATTMTDVFEYEAPLGLLGAVADALVVRRHLHGFLQQRNAVLKRMAEATGPAVADA